MKSSQDLVSSHSDLTLGASLEIQVSFYLWTETGHGVSESFSYDEWSSCNLNPNSPLLLWLLWSPWLWLSGEPQVGNIHLRFRLKSSSSRAPPAGWRSRPVDEEGVPLPFWLCPQSPPASSQHQRQIPFGENHLNAPISFWAETHIWPGPAAFLSSLTTPLAFFSFYPATLALLLFLKLYKHTSLLEAQQSRLWDSQLAQW